MCSTGKLDLQEDESQADRLYSALYLVCGTCSHRLLINTSKSISVEGTHCQWEVNRCTEQVKINLNIEEDLFMKIFHGYGIPYHISNPKNNITDIIENIENEHVIDEQPDQIDDEIDNFSEDILDNDNFEKVEDELNSDSENVRDHSVTADNKVLLTEALDDQGRISLKSPESDSSKAEASTSKPTTKNKTYTCLICNRKFRRLGALKQHSREHNGQETFSCPECMETFQDDDTLKQHMKTHVKSNLQCNVKNLSCVQLVERQWQQSSESERPTGDNPAASEPIQVPVSVTGTDVVSLTQVIPYLETIRVEYY
ncbi:hypothetical protein C0J52_25837 [Blattella germanica]|nr:hypothetical protein C0J52_25837 [Blattella germanica]